MSEMVERVTNAIYAQTKLATDKECRAAARAAIEAMREPTDDMENAGYAAGPYWDELTPLQVWQAMNDAALK